MTRDGFLISQIKQIQGRVFGRLLTEAGIDEFNGAQGHITRYYDPKDRRQIRIRRTDNARRLESKCKEGFDEMSRLFYKGFTDEEILRPDTGLEKILKNLEEEERKI